MKDEVSLLARTPDVVASLVGGLGAEILGFREGADAWTIREVVCHMADGEITDWMPRVRQILSDRADEPFVPFDRVGGVVRYQGWAMPALLAEFGALRRRNLDELSRLSLDTAALARTGRHPELGRVTLEQLIATWATHDAAHLAQISRVLARYFGQAVGPWRAYFSLLRDAPR
jgi:hypothetical protein